MPPPPPQSTSPNPLNANITRMPSFERDWNFLPLGRVRSTVILKISPELGSFKSGASSSYLSQFAAALSGPENAASREQGLNPANPTAPPPPLVSISRTPLPVSSIHETPMEQERPAPKVELQLLEKKKGPVIVIPVIFTGVLPTFVTVTERDVSQMHLNGGIGLRVQLKLSRLGEISTCTPEPFKVTV